MLLPTCLALIAAFSPTPPQEPGHPYVLVVLRKGPRMDQLEEPVMAEAMRGHFANMKTMAEAGHLMVAGPLGPPKLDPEDRGLYLFDTADVAEALKLTESDPAVAAGVFRADAYPWWTEYPMQRINELERAAKTARIARDPALADAWSGAGYTLVTSDTPELADEVLAEFVDDDTIVFTAATGTPDAPRHVYAFQTDEAATRERLAAVDPNGELEWALQGWYASTKLRELPRLLRCPEGPTFDLRPLAEVPALAPFAPAFSKTLDVFGVTIVATEATADRSILHAGHVLAQYLDNDEDGIPDNAEVVRELRERGAFLAMSAGESEFEELELDFGRLAELGFEIGQDLYGEETLPEGPPHSKRPGRFDASLEEVLHLVSHGYEAAYPETFAFESGSRLCAAMDVARGGHFERIPDSYPKGAWYTYDDPTCDYSCQAAEYFYWCLTSLLGGQDYPGRASEIENEWRFSTPDRFRNGDAAAAALFGDPRFRLPRVLPDGGYRE